MLLAPLKGYVNERVGFLLGLRFRLVLFLGLFGGLLLYLPSGFLFLRLVGLDGMIEGGKPGFLDFRILILVLLGTVDALDVQPRIHQNRECAEQEEHLERREIGHLHA